MDDHDGPSARQIVLSNLDLVERILSFIIHVSADDWNHVNVQGANDRLGGGNLYRLLAIGSIWRETALRLLGKKAVLKGCYDNAGLCLLRAHASCTANQIIEPSIVLLDLKMSPNHWCIRKDKGRAKWPAEDSCAPSTAEVHSHVSSAELSKLVLPISTSNLRYLKLVVASRRVSALDTTSTLSWWQSLLRSTPLLEELHYIDSSFTYATDDLLDILVDVKSLRALSLEGLRPLASSDNAHLSTSIKKASFTLTSLSLQRVSLTPFQREVLLSKSSESLSKYHVTRSIFRPNERMTAPSEPADVTWSSLSDVAIQCTTARMSTLDLEDVSRWLCRLSRLRKLWIRLDKRDHPEAYHYLLRGILPRCSAITVELLHIRMRHLPSTSSAQARDVELRLELADPPGWVAWDRIIDTAKVLLDWLDRQGFVKR